MTLESPTLRVQLYRVGWVSAAFLIAASNVRTRALYFALADIIHRFHSLKCGRSLVLVVGLKMILNAWFGTEVVPTEIALLITAVLIDGSILFSMWKTRGLPAEEAAKSGSPTAAKPIVASRP